MLQEFPQNACIIDISKYSEADLTDYTSDYYPIIITAETIYVDGMENSGTKNNKQAQITYGYFKRLATGDLQFMFIKQCFMFRNKIFKLQDMYGFENTSDQDGGADDS